MKTILVKISAVLAFGIGIMAIYAGGKAMLAVLPDTSKINWLTIYNFSIGFITVVLTVPLLWKSSRYAPLATVSTWGMHTLMLVFLQTAYSGMVSPDSLRAMGTRVLVWSMVLSLMLIHKWIDMVREKKVYRANASRHI